ncbi:uncharacterized protein LOC112693987 [Sipha flava]|uniref:Uncharacterized protein LOC112693987 n=1 Tax=Sipha flava TaxID=143950 RepID=A0A8B8GP77_9HEMI|nr:uncharacterized protein LOC112693987 [Sipha flava]
MNALLYWSLFAHPFRLSAARPLVYTFSHSIRFTAHSAKMTTIGLDSIPTWPIYFEQVLNGTIRPSVLKSLNGPKPNVNKKLNDKVSIYQGDITKLALDVIVNAANNELIGGGGVDGAIHRAAGSKLKEECLTLNGCKMGCAKITKGYKLPAKYVIHTVGPRGEQQDKLQTAYESCLNLAVEKKLRTIAFPCISTGVYGYPQEEAAIVALRVIRDFLEHDHNLIERIIFCVFLDEDKEYYEKYLPLFFPLE